MRRIDVSDVEGDLGDFAVGVRQKLKGSLEPQLAVSGCWRHSYGYLKETLQLSAGETDGLGEPFGVYIAGEMLLHRNQ